MVADPMKDVLKSATVEYGVEYVIMIGLLKIQLLYAINYNTTTTIVS